MKTCMKTFLGLLLAGLLAAHPVIAESMSTDQLIEELQAMKARIQELESRLAGAVQKEQRKPPRPPGPAASRASRTACKGSRMPLTVPWRVIDGTTVSS